MKLLGVEAKAQPPPNTYEWEVRVAPEMFWKIRAEREGLGWSWVASCMEQVSQSKCRKIFEVGGDMDGEIGSCILLIQKKLAEIHMATTPFTSPMKPQGPGQ